MAGPPSDASYFRQALRAVAEADGMRAGGMARHDGGGQVLD